MRLPANLKLAAIQLAAVLFVWSLAGPAYAQDITMSLRKTDVAEALEMIARQHRLSVLVAEGVSGEVSLSLYDVSADTAIRSIAEAGGHAVEKRRGTYFVMPRDQVGRYAGSNITSIEHFPIHYADPQVVGETLREYLSAYGKLRVFPQQRAVVVSDKPEFLGRIRRLIDTIDQQPLQVLIEASILEITLTNEDAYGIDWSKLFNSDGGSGVVGTRGIANPGGSLGAGLFFDLLTPNVDVTLSALNQDGRVRTLSTPKLMALNNEEASVVIGDRRGYQVTTTINQVTTESVEFLESGVILRVIPHIDASGRVLLDIHPEVSTGAVDAAGIPSQTTTEVTTSVLVPDGETVFIGGLMKSSASEGYARVPILGRTPVLKRLFSNRERNASNTETIVLIRPQIIRSQFADARALSILRQTESELDAHAGRLEGYVEAENWDPSTERE
ncbi:MAG: secretin N-terminal domain-containing protein [Pseudomonadota bacterium]